MGGFEVTHLARRPGGTVTKSGREIMEILEAYDLTGCAHSAAQLAGTDRKTVARYVALRDPGRIRWRRSAVPGRSMGSWPRWRSWSTGAMAGSAPMWCTAS